MKPLRVDILEHRELTSSKSGERFSLSASLTDPFRFKDVSVHHEVLEPGRRSSSSHSHTHREEMVFVIEGNPTGHLNGRRIDLAPGEAFGFYPGLDNFHYVSNETSTRVRLLVIASNPKEDQVIYESSALA